ncbi:MAG TPA: hypothetical protein VKA89_07830 [Solirubrobacterales bacterium]|nr:hypothetical protein [Solirubrobacterales bacterium]
MTVVLIAEIPNGSYEQYLEVNRKAEVDDNPPDGLIIHTAGRMENGGGLRIVDVWDSREAYDRFDEERLGPALREAMPEMPADAPGPQFHEVENTIQP